MIIFNFKGGNNPDSVKPYVRSVSTLMFQTDLLHIFCVLDELPTCRVPLMGTLFRQAGMIVYVYADSWLRARYLTFNSLLHL